MPHEVTLITGDGTGPDLCDAARRCIDATGVQVNWDVQEAGVDVMARAGTPLPDAVLKSIERTRCALKGPITTPVGSRFRSINVHLRQVFGLYACIRPCKQYPGVRTFFDGVPLDLVIVRENTEDLYAGIEFERGKPETGEPIGFIAQRSPDRRVKAGKEETGISIKPNQRFWQRADCALRLRVRGQEQAAQGHGRAPGERYEAQRRVVPGNGSACGCGVCGHRV